MAHYTVQRKDRLLSPYRGTGSRHRPAVRPREAWLRHDAPTATGTGVPDAKGLAFFRSNLLQVGISAVERSSAGPRSAVIGARVIARPDCVFAKWPRDHASTDSRSMICAACGPRATSTLARLRSAA